MVEGKCKESWNHTANLICAIVEPNRNRKKKPEPFEPSDFHPYLKKRKRTKVKMRDVKGEIMGALGKGKRRVTLTPPARKDRDGR